MPRYTLTMLDTIGIQEYIFGSNVLRENIGASELVRRATRVYPLEELRSMGRTNVRDSGPLTGDRQDLEEARHVERDDLAAEVIYAGGGNCVILFRDVSLAHDFVTNLSRKLIVEAPDLKLAVVHLGFFWEPGDSRSESLAGKVKEGLAKLSMIKLDRRTSLPLLGVGTTLPCQSTGLPAVGTDADEPDLKAKRAAPRPLAASILAKLRAVPDATAYLKRLLPDLERQDVDLGLPYDFDDLGREEGAMSYIAVVHADGNGMGDLIGILRDHLADPDKNRKYIETMRAFSDAVEQASRQALHQLVLLLLHHCHREDGCIIGQAADESGRLVPLGQVNMARDREKNRPYLPFRPIVCGGDDLTFVADGRLGLSLTAAYLDLFEKAAAEECAARADVAPYLDRLRASAGISVVKSHYPFARAYALSEELCREAKRAWQRRVSAMDWHFASAGLFGELEAIRDRHYAVPAGRLEMRPISLRPVDGTWRTWPAFAHVVQEFLIGPAWTGKRNKVLGLREALRDGPDAVRQFRSAYELQGLPALTGDDEGDTTGWVVDRALVAEGKGPRRCGYLDAIEATEFFVPLQG